MFALRRSDVLGDAAIEGEGVPAWDWPTVFECLTVALQPVVSLRGGRVIGYEAFVRVADGGRPDLAALSPRFLLDTAARTPEIRLGEGELSPLVSLECRIWSLAVDSFRQVPSPGDMRLFLNLDNRLLGQWRVLSDHLIRDLSRVGLDPAVVSIEINEHLPLAVWAEETALGVTVEDGLEAIVQALTSLGRTVGKVALDNFGAGNASLPLLHALQPDYVKFDRYFVDGVHEDQTKKLFLASLVNICHLMGIQTVAKGLETAEDYYACRDAGVDMIQGNLLARPETDPTKVRVDFPEARALNAQDQRSGQGDERLVAAQILDIAPLERLASMTDVFNRFRRDKERTFFPVVDESGEPIGLVRESDLKDYTYSPYGKDLINNKHLGRNLAAFVSRCPTVDISTRAEKILEVFSNNAQSEGLIITEDGKYRGFLTTPSLLKIINEKNLVVARDQNPLSKLPGNAVINEYLADTLAQPDDWLALAYIDFDFFKPFNDKYGFRQGDRAILLFAELMRAHLANEGHFIGHVGGDDFFAGMRGLSPGIAEARIRALVRRFEQDVASFYDEETRSRGYIVAKDREGVERRMPLLSASSAIVLVPPGHDPLDVDAISSLIAQLKKDAKRAESKIASATIPTRRETAPGGVFP
ncbi:MAG: GGDEF domain-containing protein [Rhodospirillum sp.]|nr:GGDEF domain-containing protein [Rhodospirillum sp.]MCF8491723.1 GGDEF domain-containing protein [Rhodospirillum sp.]MCF8499456.1 GGDEF domain-containing protein [Rhodospirillum sp.]